MRRHLDIKHPRHKSPTPRVVRVPVDLPYIPISRPEPTRPSHPFRVPVIGAVLVFLSVAGFFGFSIVRFKDRAEQSAPKIYSDFKTGAAALFDFDIEKAKQAFSSASSEIGALNSRAPLKTVPAILENLFKLSQTAVGLSENLGYLKSNALALLINKKGAFLIEHFKKLQNQLRDVGRFSDLLGGQAADLGKEFGDEFQGLNGKIGEADQFLTAFLNWLEAPRKQRLLIFFQNPSEIRPGGGFIGSYGHATLFQGNLLDLEVRDIYDPDGQLDVKVVPPRPLQGITDKWGARDANWFFDFPTSAKKVTAFLEASKIYSEQGIKFSGAIAVNVEMVRDILEVIGSVELPEYQKTITSSNVLAEIQKEVEGGQDKAKGEPKRVLKVLTPKIFEALSKLSDFQKEDLLLRFSKRFANKDAMVYFKDPVIEKYLKDLGAAGEVAVLPENFSGDYLAVANANVAGGKSDAFVEQSIRLISKFQPDGRVKNQLTIRREHNGEDEKDWWYRSTNRSYIQVFTPPGSKLIKTTGATAKTIKPLVNYAASNFSVDEDLASLEAAGTEVFGKTMFARWLEVKAGAAKELQMDYFTHHRFNGKADSYQFIFEKQSGVGGSLEISLEAPVGFKWRESDSPVFTYASQDLPARIVLDLNLIPR
jgi:hypothetical protein